MVRLFIVGQLREQGYAVFEAETGEEAIALLTREHPPWIGTLFTDIQLGGKLSGWDVAEAYGVIANLDLTETFIKAVEAQSGLTHAFIVTDEDRLFEAMVRQLPEHVEPVRLYSSYLRNFEIEAGRAAR